MSETKNGGKLLLHALISIVLLFNLLGIFIGTTQPFFGLELLGFLFLTILTLVGLITYSNQNAELVFFFMYALYLANLIFISIFRGQFYVLLVILSLVGFFLSLPQRRSSEEDRDLNLPQEPHSVVFDQPDEQSPEEVKVQRATPKTKAPKATVKHSPGKYVASKRSNIYHEPKCDWGKKIKEERRVWFAKKEDAWEQGYKAHNCVSN